MSIIRSFLASLATRFKLESRGQRAEKFVEQYLLPDMVENGFGFGRAAVGAALARLGKTSFDEVFNLTPADLAVIQSSRGVGRKVYDGFLRYLAKRGVLIAAGGEPVVVSTPDNNGGENSQCSEQEATATAP